MNPYPGLRPFRADEAALFTGREMVAETVATRLRLSPITLLFARSGVGKSSFLTCRLIPLLAETSRVRYLNEWDATPPEVMIEQEVGSLQGGYGEFSERPVLILDQFEDLFKLPSNRDGLWDTLAGLVNIHDAPVSVLVSMREEWLGAWEEATDYLPDALSSLVRLSPLTDGELRRAVLRPAEVEGSVAVSADLVPFLLDDLRRPSAYGLGGAYVEPGLLQLVCRRLWDEAAASAERAMDVALYTRLGRSEQIEREFIWSDLGSAGQPAGIFTAAERLVWVGLTRYLMAAPGVKAVVGADSLARRLQWRDLGAAGPAVMAASVGRRSRGYLRASPELRGEPPADVVALIDRVLKKGADLGFLKQQSGTVAAAEANVPAPAEAWRYELAHDALGELFQQFAVEFQGWMRQRVAILFGGLIGLLIVLPLFVNSWHQHGFAGAVGSLLAGAALVTIIWGLRRLFGLAVELLVYPLVRRLASGRMPLEREQPGRPASRTPRARADGRAKLPGGRRRFRN